jgi:hypothetical protein
MGERAFDVGIGFVEPLQNGGHPVWRKISPAHGFSGLRLRLFLSCLFLRWLSICHDYNP